MFTTRKQKFTTLLAFFVVSAALAKPLFSNSGLVLAFRNGPDTIHVAVVVDASAQTTQFYVNGQAYTNVYTLGNYSDINFNLTNNLYVAAPDPVANPNRVPFDGSMREIMIFNRALSADDVQKIYTSTRTK